jgi:hypothetical protein
MRRAVRRASPAAVSTKVRSNRDARPDRVRSVRKTLDRRPDAFRDWTRSGPDCSFSSDGARVTGFFDKTSFSAILASARLTVATPPS